MRSIKDKVIVITGASKGIGEAIARTFANKQTKLLLCGRNKTRLEKVARSLGLERSRVATVIADITRPAGMRKIVRTAVGKFGVIDIFVNNAGVGTRKNLVETTEKEFDLMMDTNLRSVFYSFKELVPIMLKQGFGQIINISSLAGKAGVPGLSVYCASKAALNTLSEAVAGEVRNRNIKICVLAPGSTATDFQSGMSGKPRRSSGTAHKLTVNEVAGAVLFLATQNENAFTSMTELRPLITKS